ncbi:hypothetical protein [Specibacter sp. NPDC078709]|uniref:hypothetical protein n=1 Tax=Specibacter sp. NPDC078709 TaxID=3154364 RepID=UPI0034257A59
MAADAVAGGVQWRREHGERTFAGRERSVTALTKVLADWPAADVNQFADLLHRFHTSIEDYSRAQVPAPIPSPHRNFRMKHDGGSPPSARR